MKNNTQESTIKQINEALSEMRNAEEKNQPNLSAKERFKMVFFMTILSLGFLSVSALVTSFIQWDLGYLYLTEIGHKSVETRFFYSVAFIVSMLGTYIFINEDMLKEKRIHSKKITAQEHSVISDKLIVKILNKMQAHSPILNRGSG